MSSDSTMDLIMENAQVAVTDVLGRVERSDPNPEAPEVDEAVGHTVVDQAVRAMVESPRAEKAFKRAGVDIGNPSTGAALRDALAATVTMFLSDQGVTVQGKSQSAMMLRSISR